MVIIVSILAFAFIVFLAGCVHITVDHHRMELDITHETMSAIRRRLDQLEQKD